MSEPVQPPAHAPGATTPASAALSLWAHAYKVELIVFAIAFLGLAGFSSQRFWRQSAAPHFVYQAKAWLEGRQDIDAEVLPNFEDWACVREVNGVKQRCTVPLLASDRWFSSFPWFPSVVMAPFVALHGYQFNDASFGVLIGALAVALFFMLLRQLAEREGTGATALDNAVAALLLGFGTVFFYAGPSRRGLVLGRGDGRWADHAVPAPRGGSASADARWAVLVDGGASRARRSSSPAVFFVFEALVPTRGQRVADWKVFLGNPRPKLRLLGQFAVGAAPLGLLAVWSNLSRFGSVAEFGHRFFFNNRVNHDIDTWGLFSPHYLLRNLDAAFLKLPTMNANPRAARLRRLGPLAVHHPAPAGRWPSCPPASPSGCTARWRRWR
jgi:hypothetical protein